MTTEATTQAKRPGPKPIGEKPLTNAERVRRHRAKARTAGVKEFLLKVQGLHLTCIEQVAAHEGVSAGVVLHPIFEAALDRYVGLMTRCDRMIDNGATSEQAADFMKAHWMPELPPMPELATKEQP